MKQKSRCQKQYQLIKVSMLLLLLSLFNAGALCAQERTINGSVTDKSGVTLPGISVVVKGTTTGVITDANGKFSIKVADNNAVLVISFIGYDKQELAVGEQTSVNIELEEELTQLNEVIVVGYGSMQRSNVAGSISSIKSDDIKRTPTPNAIEAIRGQVPGVRITRSSGQPGSDVDITIRGVRSLGATSDKTVAGYVNPNNPLVVVDGVPIVGGKISDINPNDIASMDILKDAAATSVYGSSASNG